MLLSPMVSYTFLAEGLPQNRDDVDGSCFPVFRYLYLIHVRDEGGAPGENLAARPAAIPCLSKSSHGFCRSLSGLN